MNDYGMTLIAGGREIDIPVLPEKLKVTSPGNNDTATVLVLGDILILRKKGTSDYRLGQLFPGRMTRPMSPEGSGPRSKSSGPSRTPATDWTRSGS